MPKHFLPHSALQSLIDVLAGQGYAVIAPQARNGSIVYEEARQADELPWGVSLNQAAGSSRTHQDGHSRCFAWANGPQALKPLVFAPSEPLWRIARTESGFAVEVDEMPKRPLAVIGVRACDLAALAIQDRHFLGGPHPDPHYGARREDMLLVAVNCTHPASTCFCASTGDGPEARSGFDLALTELDDGFIAQAGSPAGERLLAALPLQEAQSEKIEAAAAGVRRAAESQTRAIPGTNLRDALMARLDHGRWQEVGERCLACGNCTMVCPTCFCHAEVEQPGLDGSDSLHIREWDSCFGERHGYIHGKQLRPEISQRYRQWLTHKLASWHDQFGRSGCVGCGRCIAWCPVGIDITEEATALLK
ncbi:sulfite reductase subunit A [Betaproteobacteria bacterium SCN2]|jgi:ferredoxin|nr:sulfite reductase subunit A [Betaproteobacteria bacterium SCN2]